LRRALINLNREMTEEQRAWYKKKQQEQEKIRFRLYYWEYGSAKKLLIKTKGGGRKQAMFPDVQSAEYEAQRLANKMGIEVFVIDYPPYDPDAQIVSRSGIVSIFWPEMEDSGNA